MSQNTLLKESLSLVLEKSPYLSDFFDSLNIKLPPEGARTRTLKDFILAVPVDTLTPYQLDHDSLMAQLLEFDDRMQQFRRRDQSLIQKITIKAGQDKSGRPEPMDVALFSGEVVSVVGPTGSGKSRLLADIECLAQGDTPSGRKILLDDQVPDEKRRFSGEHQLVAQLSQNMNFVMDLTVKDFLQMHAESRLVPDIPEKTARIFKAAVDLAGEPFTLETPVTSLSGGQSRALMIADVAYLSASPVVLIDEIENAGVDRLKAVALLVREEKFVLMATHDPLLALSCHRRIVIKNGGMVKVMNTTPEEKEGVEALSRIDKKLALLRDRVRQGDHLVFDSDFF